MRYNYKRCSHQYKTIQIVKSSRCKYQYIHYIKPSCILFIKSIGQEKNLFRRHRDMRNKKILMSIFSIESVSLYPLNKLITSLSRGWNVLEGNNVLKIINYSLSVSLCISLWKHSLVSFHNVSLIATANCVNCQNIKQKNWSIYNFFCIPCRVW